jgi:hypothetical protein
MIDSLAMQPDGLGSAAAKPSTGGMGIKTAKVMVQLAQFVGTGLALRRQVQPAPQTGWKLRLPVTEQLDVVPADGAQGIVHAVNAGAGHDPQHGAAKFWRRGGHQLVLLDE